MNHTIPRPPQEQPVLVCIEFVVCVAREAYVAHCTAIVEKFAAVAGLCWKAWWFDDAVQRAGGVYLFRDPDSARAWLAGPIVAGLRANPALRAVRARALPVLRSLTSITGRALLPA